MKSYRWTYVVIAVLIVAAAAVLYFAYFNHSGSKYKIIQEAPDFEFTNLDGETVTLENTNGKVRLMYYFFSNCRDVCPPTTYFLSEIQTELVNQGRFGKDTAFLQITIDPENDTVERLKEYSSGYHADYSGWYFLRGEESYTHQIAQQYQVGVQKLGDADFVHSNLYILIDKEGNIRHIYPLGMNLEEFDPTAIAQDMIDLANE